jgi:uncharacterized SAM-binding protein YcdF (DUF218 family)
MDTPESLSERSTPRSSPSIYEAAPTGATRSRDNEGITLRALSGFVFGAAAWAVIAQLGIPNIFGLGASGGELPAGILGAIIGLTRLRRLLLFFSFSLLVLLGIVAFTNLIDAPARSFIRRDALPPQADAVVVLSGGVTRDGFIPQQGTDRLRKALELMRANVAPTLVVTRERIEAHSGEVSSVADQDKLIALAGVNSVLSTGWARSTHDEAAYVSAIAKRRGWSHVVLVTSAFHSRRACATFEKAGLRVSCVPADSRDVSVNTLETPRDRIEAFKMWIYELAGTVRYKQMGWM